MGHTRRRGRSSLRLGTAGNDTLHRHVRSKLHPTRHSVRRLFGRTSPALSGHRQLHYAPGGHLYRARSVQHIRSGIARCHCQQCHGRRRRPNQVRNNDVKCRFRLFTGGSRDGYHVMVEYVTKIMDGRVHRSNFFALVRENKSDMF